MRGACYSLGGARRRPAFCLRPGAAHFYNGGSVEALEEQRAMKILLVGSGGREHALAWKLAQSPHCDKLYAAPGNPGMARCAECVPIQAEDLDGLQKFAVEKKIGLTVVGPEQPLVAGIVDRFRAAGLRIFGPTREAAQVEGSKEWAKTVMMHHAVPTAEFRLFTKLRDALRYIEQHEEPLVV